MDTEHKLFDLKMDDDSGKVAAVFATLNVVDRDGDITLPGAFGTQDVKISAYGHTSWRGALPVGVGKIYERGNEAIFEGQFFLNTSVGREHYETLRALQQAGQPSEWSYGFRILDSEWATVNGEQVRYLKRNEVYEVSPVLVGAGIGTRTLDVKTAGLTFVAHAETLQADVDAFVKRASELAALRAKEGRTLSAANRQRLQTLLDSLNAVKGDLEMLLAETEPKTLNPLPALFMEYQRIVSGVKL